MAKKKSREILDASENLADKAKTREHLIKYYKKVEKGFQDQRERCDSIMDYWDMYNCKLTGKQFYSGNSRIYVPIVRNAIDARATRFTNQLFPKSGRYIEVTSNSGDIPYGHLALMEHYVRRSKLRTKIAPALFKQGDIEGQYTVNVTWKDSTRYVRTMRKKPVTVDGMMAGEIDEFDDIDEEAVNDSFPDVEIIPDSDVLILPVTADTCEDALNSKGGSVTIIMRMQKHEVEDYIDQGKFTSVEGKALMKSFGIGSGGGLPKDTKKEIAEAAGIKIEGGKKYAQVFQTWKKLKVNGDERLCVTYYGSKNQILGSWINPYWCDLCPIVSVPVTKLAGCAKGASEMNTVETMQYAANDAINEGLDSLTYSLLPIVMTDPEKNPRTGTMILAMAALWEVDPNSTKFANFPQLYREGMQAVTDAKNEIFQTLSVNPAMMPNTSGTSKRKLNQAEIANEQQVDILSTADMVINVEEAVFTPIIERFFHYDAQFRKEDITVKTYGELGLRAKMEKITPLQMSDRYEFRWFGVEALRNIQNIQQQVSTINVIRGIPPQMMPGRVLDLTPAIEELVNNTFGPRLAPRIFKDVRSQLEMDPEIENEMMNEGLDAVVHSLDKDIEHIKSHIADMQKNGDDSGYKRIHIMNHQKQLAAKQQMLMQQQQKQSGMMAPKGLPGTPGGAGPGTAGTPRPGSVPKPPQGAKQPPGAISSDSAIDPQKVPRHI